MRKLLLFALLAALSVPSHADPPQRSVAPSFKNLLAPQERSAWQPRSAKTPALRAAEAPANAVEVPLFHSMDKDDPALADYVVVDANGDGKTWNRAITAPAAGQESHDDWMITGPVHLYAGTSYVLELERRAGTSKGKTGEMEIFAGLSQSVEAMAVEIEKENTVTGLNFVNVENKFTVPVDGYYYIGIHATSRNNETIGPLQVKNLKIDVEKPKVIPPAAGELSYELAPKGELKASVRYVAPKKDIEGNDLEAITKVEIKTNWVVSHTFENVTPGQTIDFETELLHSPYNIIEAIAYIEDTPGESAKVKDFYAGLDNPMPVQNVVASLADDFKHVTLSWEPVGEVGESG